MPAVIKNQITGEHKQKAVQRQTGCKIFPYIPKAYKNLLHNFFLLMFILQIQTGEAVYFIPVQMVNALKSLSVTSYEKKNIRMKLRCIHIAWKDTNYF